MSKDHGGQKATHQDASLLRRGLDALRNGIMVLAPDYTVLGANRWVTRRYGRDRDCQGLKCWEVMAGLSAICEGCPLAQALEKAEVATAELAFPLPGGGEQWLQVTAHPFPGGDDDGGAIIHIKDVSEARRARLEHDRLAEEIRCSFEDLQALKVILQTSRDKFKAVFDAIMEPVYSITPEGLVESVNAAAAKLTGHHPRELVGLSCSEVLGKARPSLPAAECCGESLAAAVDSGEMQERLVEMPGEDGPRYFDLIHTPVPSPEGGVGLVIVQVKDVTNYKRMEATIREYSQHLEEKVAHRTRELSQANAELKRVDQLRRDLFNMVVHDMKSPLAELMGNLDLLTYGELDENQQQILDMGLMGAEDLLRMIMNLLDIERMEEDQLPVKPEVMGFGELASEVCSRFATMITLKELKVEVEDGLPGALHGDRELLGRVLQNLLTNALHYTEEGGGITLSALPEPGGGVLISVADTGSGIPPEKRIRIFDKFTQADDDGGPRTSTGLGLTFCKLAVEAHGGRIWLESEVGRGTTFFVWLPDPPAQADPQPDPES